VPLILAAAALLAVIAGYWLYQRGRSRTASAELGREASESVTSTTGAPASVPTAAPGNFQRQPKPEPTSIPAAEVSPPAPPSGVAAAPAASQQAVPQPQPTAPRPPKVRPTRAVETIADASRASTAAVQAPAAPSAASSALVRYCATVEPTSYAQAAVKEKPAGFDTGGGEVFRGPRPDAARITIQVDVSPSNPVGGQPFRVIARIVNGGDTSITLSKIEESAARAKGGFQSTGVPTPANVQVGAAFTLYDAQTVLTEGNSYIKDVKVTDAVGDTWKTSVRIGVCPE
jgi:hypothetical protein